MFGFLPTFHLPDFTTLFSDNDMHLEPREISTEDQKTLRERDQHIQAMVERLTQTEERVSETEVLGIVRDLNENIFQVAANLTEEWEKLESSQASRFTITERDIEDFSRFYGPALIQPALDRDPAAVTFLVQSCLCYLAMEFTSRWRHDKKLAILGSVYETLSTSEGQAISARWRSLTHSHLPKPPLHSTTIVRYVGDVLWITGLFSSCQRSRDFVKEVALKGIETIDRLVLRLEVAFMEEVASSDMSLLFGTPQTTFDETRMINEFEPCEVSTPGRRDKVAGTTEVGVGKSMCGGRGEDRRTEILTKAKVVLEKDLADP